MTDQGMPDGGFSAEIPSTPPVTTPAAPDFLSLVPEDYKAEPWVENFAKSDKPVDNFFKSYKEAQSQIGKLSGRIEVPGEGATPEQVANFRKALGVPESAEGYEYTKPDLSSQPEPVQKIFEAYAEQDAALFDAVRKVAHEMNVPPKALAALTQTVLNHNLGTITAIAEAQAKEAEAQSQREVEAFKGHFGERAEQVLRISKETAAKIGIPEGIAKAGGEAALSYALHFIHEKLFSNGSISTTDNGVPSMSKAEVHAKIMKMRQETAYKDPFHPNHKQYKAQVDEMYREHANMK